MTCPCCCHNPEKEGRFQSQDEEIELINKRAQAIVDLIDGLWEERARLFSRINTIRSSTRAVPHEILSAIFQIVCPPLVLGKEPPEAGEKTPKPILPLILGAVSRHWRSVAWTTPKLWDTIALGFLTEHAQYIALPLQTYIENSDCLPVTLELDFRMNQRSLYRGDVLTDWLVQSDDSMEPVASALFSVEHAKKIRTLTLHAPPPSWLPLIQRNCTTLRSLTLSWSIWPRARDPPFRDLLPANDFAACLQDCLYQPWTEVQHLWTNLTTLNLNNVPIDICFDLLIRCPNLTAYTCWLPWTLAVSPGKPSRQETDLDSLEFLHWEVGINQWNYSLLRFLRFPSLRHLVWGVGGQVDLFAPFISEFYLALPQTLETLELCGNATAAYIPPELFVAAFQNAPNLYHLVFRDWPFWSVQVAFKMLQNPAILPALRALSWKSPRAFRVDFDMNNQHLFTMIDTRQRLGIKEFSLTLEDVPLIYNPEAHNKLWASALSRGLEITILKNGKRIGFPPDNSQMDTIRW